MNSCKFFYYRGNPGGGPFSLMKANLSIAPVFRSSSPSFVFGFIFKMVVNGCAPALNNCFQCRKTTTKDKKLSEILVNSLLFSINCLRRQMMNSLWA